MSKYVILLEEARSKILPIKETIMTTAPEYIPKLYEAYANENPNLNPMEVRKRIEEDCKDLWSKRTILDALPDEAKNLPKQKAGRQKNKNKVATSAAMTAAPKLEEQILLDNVGRTVPDNDISYQEPSNNFNSINRKDEQNPEASSDNSLSDQILDFEFCLKFKKIQQHMASLFNRIGENGDIWFNGKIDTNSCQVVEANIGRK